MAENFVLPVFMSGNQVCFKTVLDTVIVELLVLQEIYFKKNKKIDKVRFVSFEFTDWFVWRKIGIVFTQVKLGSQFFLTDFILSPSSQPSLLKNIIFVLVIKTR